MDERLDQLGEAAQILAEDQTALQIILAELTNESGKGFDAAGVDLDEMIQRLRDIESHVENLEAKIHTVEARLGQTAGPTRLQKQRTSKRGAARQKTCRKITFSI